MGWNLKVVKKLLRITEVLWHFCDKQVLSVTFWHIAVTYHTLCLIILCLRCFAFLVLYSMVLILNLLCSIFSIFFKFCVYTALFPVGLVGQDALVWDIVCCWLLFYETCALHVAGEKTIFFNSSDISKSYSLSALNMVNVLQIIFQVLTVTLIGNALLNPLKWSGVR